MLRNAIFLDQEVGGDQSGDCFALPVEYQEIGCYEIGFDTDDVVVSFAASRVSGFGLSCFRIPLELSDAGTKVALLLSLFLREARRDAQYDRRDAKNTENRMIIRNDLLLNSTGQSTSGGRGSGSRGGFLRRS